MTDHVMRRLGCVVLAVAVLACLTACASKAPPEPTAESSSAPKTSSPRSWPSFSRPSPAASADALKAPQDADEDLYAEEDLHAHEDPWPESGCPDHILLPAGVSEMVCDGVPMDATYEPAHMIAANGIYSFMTPSGNIFCDWVGGYGPEVDDIQCAINKADFAPPRRPKNCDAAWEGYQIWLGRSAGKGVCRGDVMNAVAALHSGVRLPVLSYGESVFYGQFVCSSAKDGLTCWNTDTYHGFKLSRAAQITW